MDSLEAESSFPFEQVGEHRFAKWREGTSATAWPNPLTVRTVIVFLLGCLAYKFLLILVILMGVLARWDTSLLMALALLIVIGFQTIFFVWMLSSARNQLRKWLDLFRKDNPDADGIVCAVAGGNSGSRRVVDRGVARIESGSVHFLGSRMRVVLTPKDLAAKQAGNKLSFRVPGLEKDRDFVLYAGRFPLLSKGETRRLRKQFQEVAESFRSAASEGDSIYPPLRMPPDTFRWRNWRISIAVLFAGMVVLMFLLDLAMFNFLPRSPMSSGWDYAGLIGALAAVYFVAIGCDGWLRRRAAAESNQVDAIVDRRRSEVVVGS